MRGGEARAEAREVDRELVPRGGERALREARRREREERRDQVCVCGPPRGMCVSVSVSREKVYEEGRGKEGDKETGEKGTHCAPRR